MPHESVLTQIEVEDQKMVKSKVWLMPENKDTWSQLPQVLENFKGKVDYFSTKDLKGFLFGFYSSNKHYK